MSGEFSKLPPLLFVAVARTSCAFVPVAPPSTQNTFALPFASVITVVSLLPVLNLPPPRVTVKRTRWPVTGLPILLEPSITRATSGFASISPARPFCLLPACRLIDRAPLAVALATNVAGELASGLLLKLARASSLLLYFPASGPSSHETWALPSALVFTTTVSLPLTLPPPAFTINVTEIFAMPLVAHLSVMRTITGAGKTVLACPPKLSPANLRNTEALPRRPVALNVCGEPFNGESILAVA
ncbi:MAG: hypothetical protein ALAOOOJD_00987 [bacterium]|nr:hypothetical protein [bacterium]